MSNVELFSFASDLELAKAAASRWLEFLESSEPVSHQTSVALSGGRIARRFFSEFANLAASRRVSLNSVHFFWGDERCVPPTDPESNFAVAQELLFTPLKISSDRIHRIRGEDVPDSAATQAEAELRKIVPADASGQLMLDLVFLGMGEDGHVASLFPSETEQAISDKRVYRPVTTSKPPPRRITISYQTIAAAKQVWVLASGSGKEKALRESLAPQGATPLARVIRSRGSTKVFTDVVLR